MSLPYTLRLLCLCCASFFMIHLALAVATRLSAGTAMRMAKRLKPSSAARLLFAVRMLPFTLTLLAVWLSVFRAIFGWNRKQPAKKLDSFVS